MERHFWHANSGCEVAPGGAYGISGEWTAFEIGKQ
jgi:hypothetical protein